MVRICIVTPGQIGSNPRVVKEADALHEAGHSVTVIATRMLDRAEQRDQALMRRIAWRLRRVDLRSRLNWRLNRAAQTVGRCAYMATQFPGPADLAVSAYSVPLRHAALAEPADLYVAHYVAALPAVAAAASRHGARYAYDAEDFHLGDWPDGPAYELERRLVSDVEGRYLGKCAYITAASPAIAEAYASAYNITAPRVVLNVFPLSHAPPAPASSGTVQPGPSLYWFSQLIGPNRGLEAAVRAVGRAGTQPHLYLRGTPVAGYSRDLFNLAKSAGAAGRVHVLSPDEPDRMEELAKAYDVGLVAETGHSISRRYCLTNKLFSFLLAGVPPLMSDTPAHCRFAEEADMIDLIYPRDDDAALARLLDHCFADAERLAVLRGRVWRLGQHRYNWDLEKSHLIDLVKHTGRDDRLCTEF